VKGACDLGFTLRVTTRRVAIPSSPTKLDISNFQRKGFARLPRLRRGYARIFPYISAELEAVFCKAKCAAKRDVALAPTHPCAGNGKELPKNFDKYMIKNYSIQQSIAFLTNSPSFPINPFFSVSFLFIALSSIFLISPTLSSFILRPQNRE